MIEEINERQERKISEVDVVHENGNVEIEVAEGHRSIRQHRKEVSLLEDQTRIRTRAGTHSFQSRIRLRNSSTPQILEENYHMR